MTDKPIDLLTPAEVRALMNTFSRRAPTGIRNRALIALLYRSGLRISEALALEVRDVSVENRLLEVQRGKGGKHRKVAMDGQAFAELERWLIVRRSYAAPRSKVFCTLTGHKLDDSYVRRMLRQRADKAMIQKRVHPHGFRHTHAAELASEGKAMNLVQAQLGHANLGTTSRYLSHIMPKELAEAIGEREW